MNQGRARRRRSCRRPDPPVRVAPHRFALARRTSSVCDLGQLSGQHDRLVRPRMTVDVLVVWVLGPDVQPHLAHSRFADPAQIWRSRSDASSCDRRSPRAVPREPSIPPNLARRFACWSRNSRTSARDGERWNGPSTTLLIATHVPLRVYRGQQYPPPTLCPVDPGDHPDLGFRRGDTDPARCPPSPRSARTLASWRTPTVPALPELVEEVCGGPRPQRADAIAGHPHGILPGHSGATARSLTSDM